jgi:hypothetical protein
MAHYEMANVLARRGQFLGVPVILITALIGTSIFATITAQVIPTQAKVIVGLVSVIAAVLASLQTFYKYSERAEKHRMFGARFGSVRRELEMLYAEDQMLDDLKRLETLCGKLDRLAEEAPHVPAKVFLQVQRSILYTGERAVVELPTPVKQETC